MSNKTAPQSEIILYRKEDGSVRFGLNPEATVIKFATTDELYGLTEEEIGIVEVSAGK